MHINYSSKIKPTLIFFSLVTIFLSNLQQSYAKENCSNPFDCSKVEPKVIKSKTIPSYLVIKKNLNVRSRRSDKSRIVRVLPQNTIIQGTEQNGWVKIKDEEFVFTQYLRVVEDSIKISDAKIVGSSTPVTNSELPTAKIIDSNQVIQSSVIPATPNKSDSLIVDYLFIGGALTIGSSIYGYNLGKTIGKDLGYRRGEDLGYRRGEEVGTLKGDRSGYDRAYGEHTVEVTPVCNVENNKWLCFGSYSVKQGYFYQTYVKGVPAIKSEVTYTENFEMTEVNQEELLALTKGLAETIIKLYPAAAIANLPTKVLETKYIKG